MTDASQIKQMVKKHLQLLDSRFQSGAFIMWPPSNEDIAEFHALRDLLSDLYGMQEILEQPARIYDAGYYEGHLRGYELGYHDD